MEECFPHPVLAMILLYVSEWREEFTMGWRVGPQINVALLEKYWCMLNKNLHSGYPKYKKLFRKQSAKDKRLCTLLESFLGIFCSPSEHLRPNKPQTHSSRSNCPPTPLLRVTRVICVF